MGSSDRLSGIQWLRAIAAGLVVVEHTKNAISTVYLQLPPSVSPLSIFPFSAGVDLFFVISGFIMAYSSANLFGRAGGWRVFLLRRIARIAPLYWLITSFMILAFALRGSEAWSGASWFSVIASYLFLPSANAEGGPFPLLSIGWTLNYEMAFYAVFALFIGFREKTALALTVALISAIAAVGLLLAPSALPLQFWSNPIILEFAAGIGLYGLYRAGLLRLTLVVRLSLVLASLAVLALNAADQGLWRAVIWGGPAIAIVAATVAWSEASAEVVKTSPDRFRANLAGDLSYAVYLVHMPIILISATAVRISMPATWWVWFGLFPALVMTGTIAVACLLHFTVERPIQQAARRATSPLTVNPAVSGTTHPTSAQRHR